MKQQQHVSAELLRALSGGNLPEDQMTQLAEHIAGCPQCALVLAEQVQDNLSQPPAGFSDHVRLRIGLIAEQRLREYRRYCLRVAASVALVIISTWALRFYPLQSASPEDIRPPVPVEGRGYFDEPEQKDDLFTQLQNLYDRLTQFNYPWEVSDK